MAQRLATYREVFAQYSAGARLSGYVDITFSEPLEAGDTVEIGDAVLTAAAERTPGANTFDGTIADLVDAINDPDNAAYALAIAEVSGSAARLYPLTTRQLRIRCEEGAVSKPWLPALATVVVAALEAAASAIDTSQWLASASLGHALLAAHYLATGGTSATAGTGAVTRRKWDDLEEEYESSGGVGTQYASSYGAQFESLRDSIPGFPTAGRWY